MIEFQWLWAAALLPLPLLARYLLPAARRSRAGALRVPFFAQIAPHAGAGAILRRGGKLALLTLIWLALVLAAMRPSYVGKPVPIPVEGRDLMMAVDLSGSMARQDLTQDGLPTDRLSVVKAVADDFIARRSGDRVGLILFSSRAYIQTPLTFDRKVTRDLLSEATIGMTGQETAIGDAIGLAVKTLQDRPEDKRVLVLLTDGANNSGVLDPIHAAELARQEHVKIYTIGVGADSLAIGQQIVNPSAELDEAALAQIAAMTGGRYFRARDGAGLAAIYHEINLMEPAAGEPLYLAPTIALFHWPLGFALVLSLILAAVLLAPGLARGRAPRAPNAARAAAAPDAAPGVGGRP
ncbi:MAG TPA: VWA domain-containing protein [Xanthobacteraceae bacterium]|jgi:Ca-activated chloride channel family protein|nr:VWA domain-containing protein [Xanthobacteraceae bacterium]HQS48295.1 VWA domain-containing protein [Xanthobacteraceae bacterium]